MPVEQNVTKKVSCGGHYAESCEHCVGEEARPWFCNGDCVWSKTQQSETAHKNDRRGVCKSITKEKPTAIPEPDGRGEKGGAVYSSGIAAVEETFRKAGFAVRVAVTVKSKGAEAFNKAKVLNGCIDSVSAAGTEGDHGLNGRPKDEAGDGAEGKVEGEDPIIFIIDVDMLVSPDIIQHVLRYRGLLLCVT